MSQDPLKNKVAEFLLDNLELFGTEGNAEELRTEIRRAAIMLRDDSTHIELDMSLDEMTKVLANPPINDIDSDIGNRLGKIFKAFSKNIPMFEKCVHAQSVATVVHGLGDLVAKAPERTVSEQEQWIGFYTSGMESAGALTRESMSNVMETFKTEFAAPSMLIPESPEETVDL